MTQQEIFKKIDGILKELNDQSAYLQSGQDYLNDLELELFMANANFLTDHVEILRKLNHQLIKAADKSKHQFFLSQELQSGMVEIVQPDTPSQRIEFDLTSKNTRTSFTEDFSLEGFEQATEATAIPAKPAVEPKNIQETPVAKVEIKEQPAIIRHELTLDELEDAYEEEEFQEDDVPAEVAFEVPVAEPSKPAPKPVVEQVVPAEAESPVIVPAIAPVIEQPIAVSTQITIEETKEEQKVITINQLISAQKNAPQKDIQRIDDLKTAITLNDKLLFIRDLFNNYSLAYSEAIDLLNRFNSFEEADHFLKSSYFEKNNWAAKQITVDKFYELLHRRFA